MTLSRKNNIFSMPFVLSGLILIAACSSDPSINTANTDETGENIASNIDTEPDLDNEIDTVPPSEPSESSEPEQPDSIPNQAGALAAIENVALLYIAEENGATGLQVTSSARFYTTTSPLANEPSLQPIAMLDTCEIGSESSQINADALNVPIDHVLEGAGSDILQVRSISAGDTVEIMSTAGSYASLIKNSADNAVEYSVQDGTELSMSVPDSLSVAVPGDEFPQLSIDWLTPTRLNDDLVNSVRSIDDGAVLTWTAANTTDALQSRLHIYGGFLDELSGDFTSFQCELVDDGEFTLPADVQALYNGGLVANFVDIARYSNSVQLLNGVSVVNVFVEIY